MPGIELYGAKDMVTSVTTPYFSCLGERFGEFETEGEDFSHGIFDYGEFFTITFDNCDFSNASFEKAELRYICFIDCDFTNANFDGATVKECSFLNCGMSQSTFQCGTLENITLSECHGVMDFAEAEITGGVIYETNMAHSSFYGTTIAGTTFGNSTLTDILMSHATSYKSVVMSGCDITDVYFVMAEGGKDIMYKDCIYMPYLNPVNHTRRRSTVISSTPKLSVYNNNTSTYMSYGWDPSAELYCSSMTEYGETG